MSRQGCVPGICPASLTLSLSRNIAARPWLRVQAQAHTPQAPAATRTSLVRSKPQGAALVVCRRPSGLSAAAASGVPPCCLDHRQCTRASAGSVEWHDCRLLLLCVTGHCVITGDAVPYDGAVSCSASDMSSEQQPAMCCFCYSGSHRRCYWLLDCWRWTHFPGFERSCSECWRQDVW